MTQEAQAGGRAIDQIVQRYKATRGKVVVPEWGLTLYFSPITYADLDAIGTSDSDKKNNVRTIIFKAENKGGEKLFSSGDEAHLMANAEARVLTRIVREMVGGDAKKKSTMTDQEGAASDSD